MKHRATAITLIHLTERERERVCFSQMRSRFTILVRSRIGKPLSENEKLHFRRKFGERKDI